MTTHPPIPFSHVPGRPRTAQGFTIIEVLIATALIGLVAVGGTWSMAQSARAKEMMKGDPITASLLAKEVFELAQSLSRSPSGVTGVTSAEDIIALDSLVGASFSPPIRSDATTDSSLAGWGQQVTVAAFDLVDLDTPSGQSMAQALGSYQASVYKLTVNVSLNGEPAGQWAWWLTP